MKNPPKWHDAHTDIPPERVSLIGMWEDGVSSHGTVELSRHGLILGVIIHVFGGAR